MEEEQGAGEVHVEEEQGCRVEAAPREEGGEVAELGLLPEAGALPVEEVGQAVHQQRLRQVTLYLFFKDHNYSFLSF